MRISKELESGRHKGTTHLGSVLIVLAGVVGCASAANAVPRIAVVGSSTVWCEFLIDNGYECDNLPTAGPISFEGYDVVVDRTSTWTDPDGLLAAFMRSGRGVITGGAAPEALGIDTDPTVQAWIGANKYMNCLLNLRTIVTDPMLGTIQPGEMLTGCGFGPGPAIHDTTGHTGARILATWDDGREDATIGIMRNTWEEGGRSAYLGVIDLDTGHPLHEEIVLSTVRILSNPIPTVSEWGLVILTLLLATAGSAVLVRRRTALPAGCPPGYAADG